MGVTLSGSGYYGDGDGYGDGYGDGSGDGYGSGYYGYGDGSGDGSGDGYGSGYYGYGDGSGSGYGSSSGDGSGSGSGAGDGSGYGYGYGSGSGHGHGSGSGDKNYWNAVAENVIAAWPNDQRHRAQSALDSGALIAFWRSAQDGKPANGGQGTVAKPGLIEEIEGPLELCTPRALHGTLNPAKWNGDKIWLVALYPPIQQAEDKIGSLKREILGECDFTL